MSKNAVLLYKTLGRSQPEWQIQLQQLSRRQKSVCKRHRWGLLTVYGGLLLDQQEKGHCITNRG